MVMKVKWYVEPNNLGDVLTPFVLDHFLIKHEYVDDVQNADTLCIGSIARLALPGQSVFGSGRIRLDEKADPRVNWKFVRGPLTRENVLQQGGTCPEIYGDPALLLPDFCPASQVIHNVGIVPHYQDFSYVNSKHFLTHHVINLVSKNSLSVAREISSCRRIISSSLHGIIAAHAYGIPAAWVRLSKLHGDGTKFQDYFQSVGIKNAPVSTIENPVYIEPGKINLDYVREIFDKEAS